MCRCGTVSLARRFGSEGAVDWIPGGGPTRTGRELRTPVRHRSVLVEDPLRDDLHVPDLLDVVIVGRGGVAR